MNACAPRQGGAALLALTLALAVIACVAYLFTAGSAADLSLSNRRTDMDEARYAAEAGFLHMQETLRDKGCFNYGDLPATPFGSAQYAVTVTPTWMSPVTIVATGQTDSGAQQSLKRSGVRVFDAPTATVFDPGANVDDTWIDKTTPWYNYGRMSTIDISQFGTEIKHGLIRFDLSSIPAGAKIKIAKMRLYFEGATALPAGGSIAVHRVLADWKEGNKTGSAGGPGATWFDRTSPVSWSTPGGDYDATPVTSVVLGAAGSYELFDITPLMQSWASGTSQEFGVLLKASAGVRRAQFTSGDGSSSSQWPRLQLQYSCECGVFNCFQ